MEVNPHGPQLRFEILPMLVCFFLSPFDTKKAQTRTRFVYICMLCIAGFYISRDIFVTSPVKPFLFIASYQNNNKDCL